MRDVTFSADQGKNYLILNTLLIQYFKISLPGLKSPEAEGRQQLNRSHIKTS